jgi:hypothetical protein
MKSMPLVALALAVGGAGCHRTVGGYQPHPTGDAGSGGSGGAGGSCGPEVCNGVDDDCNGVVDDLPPITCPGHPPCGPYHLAACARGAPATCPADPPLKFESLMAADYPNVQLARRGDDVLLTDGRHVRLVRPGEVLHPDVLPHAGRFPWSGNPLTSTEDGYAVGIGGGVDLLDGEGLPTGRIEVGAEVESLATVPGTEEFLAVLSGSEQRRLVLVDRAGMITELGQVPAGLGSARAIVAGGQLGVLYLERPDRFGVTVSMKVVEGSELGPPDVLWSDAAGSVLLLQTLPLPDGTVLAAGFRGGFELELMRFSTGAPAFQLVRASSNPGPWFLSMDATGPVLTWRDSEPCRDPPAPGCRPWPFAAARVGDDLALSSDEVAMPYQVLWAELGEHWRIIWMEDPSLEIRLLEPRLCPR